MAHINRAILKEYIDDKLVTEQKHPVSDLYIYNYTPLAQFSKAWDEVTMLCRGLITDGSGRVIAAPFTKFFNYSEYTGELPSLKYIITEKMDGSLGICYPYKGVLSIATRGSFTSEQAKVGDQMLQEYIKKHGLDWYDERYTYCFEIIYPENRIVVDYGKERRLVLLAVINTNDGHEIDPHSTGYKDVVTMLPQSTELADLLAMEQEKNKEGFVIRWANGLRLKLKFEEYVRLHRLVTRVQAKDVWELLRTGSDLNEFLDNVPDEFYKWVQDTIADLKAKYNDLEFASQRTFTEVSKLATRKEIAADVVMQNRPIIRAVVFAMLDNKDYKQIIWKAIKPKYVKPFKEEV